MNKFTIKDIENLSGIKAHTIRIWEQRYQIIRPKRKSTNHRIYDNDDLKRILRISYLYHCGFKISKIAQLSEEEIKKIALEMPHQDRFYEIHANQMMEAMIDFDQIRFEKIFHNLLLHIGFEQTITKVIYPYLERVGLLWMTGNIIPAQEHFASNLIRKKILVAIDGLKLPHASPSHFLLFLPEGEFHEIPLLFAHYLLKRSGKMVTYLGCNVPLEDVKVFVGLKKVTHLYTHMVTNFTKQVIHAYVQQLAEYFPAQQIVLAGPQIHHLNLALPANIQQLPSLETMMAYTQS